MNVRLLIDAIVRETTVLIAQLATSGGVRAPLAHVASQVFVELAAELEREGVTKRVSADMFGLALRTYQRRTQRLSQSRTEQGRSLWQAVFEYIAEHSVATRAQVLARFKRDDERSLRGVLTDLVESGLVFASGKGRSRVYRATSAEELSEIGDRDDNGVESFVWSCVFREGPLELDRMLELTHLRRERLELALQRLVEAGHVERIEASAGPRYRSQELVLGLDEDRGWEASVQDHFASLSRTITRKLRLEPQAARSDEVGGSTYHFELYRGHPLEAEVLGELRRFRERMSALRARVDQCNRHDGLPARRIQVDAYYGQSFVEWELERGENQGDRERVDENAIDRDEEHDDE